MELMIKHDQKTEACEINQAIYMRNLENQSGQLAQALSSRELRALLSNTQNLGNGNDKKKCNAITLRSGKVLIKLNLELSLTNVDHQLVGVGADKKKQVLNETIGEIFLQLKGVEKEYIEIEDITGGEYAQKKELGIKVQQYQVYAQKTSVEVTCVMLPFPPRQSKFKVAIQKVSRSVATFFLLER